MMFGNQIGYIVLLDKNNIINSPQKEEWNNIKEN